MSRPHYLVALAVALELAVAGWWMQQDRFPFGFEVVEHHLYARVIADGLAAVDSPAALLGWFGEHRSSGHRATGLHLLLAPALAIAPAGRGPDLLTWCAAALTLPLLAWATYRLAADRAGPWAGCVAALAVLLLPPVWGFSRKLGVDLALTSVVCAYAVAVRRLDWTCTRRAAGLGLLAGLACLIKAQFGFWLPWLLLPSVIEARREQRLRPAPLACFLVAAALGSAFYWAGALGDRAEWASVAFAGPHSESASRWDLRALVYYPLGTARWLGPGVGVLVLVGLMRARKDPALLWWLGGGLLVWTAWPIKWMRYLLPALPALVVLAVDGLWRLPHRRFVAGLTLSVAAGYALVGSAVTPLPPTSLCHPPLRLDWRAPMADATASIALPEHRRPRFIAIDGPRDWSADKYSLLQIYLLEAFPGAEVQRRSAAREPLDLELYRDIQPRLHMRLHVGESGSTTPPPHERGWLRRGPWLLPSHSAGEAPRQVWVDLSPVLFDPHRDR